MIQRHHCDLVLDGEQLRALRGREAELSAAIEGEAIGEPTPAELAEIRAMVGDGMLDAPIPQRKAIHQKFVSEVRVESRRTIHPVIRLPSVGFVSVPIGGPSRDSMRTL